MSRHIANRLSLRPPGHSQLQTARGRVLVCILCRLLAAPAQAAQQQGTLYKFHKPGAEIHYLFGTMHTTDPRLIQMLEVMANAYMARDLVKLQQLTLKYELSSTNRALAEWFSQELIVNRNIRMAERLTGLLEKAAVWWPSAHCTW